MELALSHDIARHGQRFAGAPESSQELDPFLDGQKALDARTILAREAILLIGFSISISFVI